MPFSLGTILKSNVWHKTFIFIRPMFVKLTDLRLEFSIELLPEHEKVRLRRQQLRLVGADPGPVKEPGSGAADEGRLDGHEGGFAVEGVRQKAVGPARSGGQRGKGKR